jgi:transcriptional regulator with GAF, ATPase, and Fis domain
VSKWKQLIEKQDDERKALLQSLADKSMTLTEASRELGVTRQALFYSAKAYGVQFTGGKTGAS